MHSKITQRSLLSFSAFLGLALGACSGGVSCGVGAEDGDNSATAGLDAAEGEGDNGNGNGGDTITICHATGSDTNPYVEITISVNGLNGHADHEGDIIPAPEGGCPTGASEGEGEGDNGGDKITICHATGSDTNPYVEITVDVNGLNGHGDHEGDIIPAPAGRCPGASEGEGEVGEGEGEVGEGEGEVGEGEGEVGEGEGEAGEGEGEAGEGEGEGELPTCP